MFILIYEEIRIKTIVMVDRIGSKGIIRELWKDKPIPNQCTENTRWGIKMSKRVSIMIDDDLDKLLRKLQAKTMINTEAHYSYSNALNDTLRKVLKWLIIK